MPRISRREAVASALAWGGAVGALGSRQISAAAAQAAQAATASTAPTTTGPAPSAAPEPARPDGRHVRALGAQWERRRRTAPPLAFQPGQDRAAFESWRRKAREKLAELLRIEDAIAAAADQPPPTMLWSQPRAGYELQKWEAYPEPYSAVPFLVLVPEGASRQSPAPGVACFPGTAHSKEGLAGEPELMGTYRANDRRAGQNRMALEYVKAGFVAVAMDDPGAGEQSEPSVAGATGMELVAVNALWEGRSYDALATAQRRCVLEWLKGRADVRADRVAVSGHSFGARFALYLAVLDETVAAVVHNENGKDWRRRAIAVPTLALPVYSCLPEILRWFDYADLHAAVAPRPLLFTEGMRPPQIRRLRKAWELYAAPERLKVVQHSKFAGRPEPPDDTAADPPRFANYRDWHEYGYSDPTNHFFHADEAVPWLRSQLAS